MRRSPGRGPQEIERARATVEQAEANVRTAEVNLERARKLNRSGVFAKQALDDAQNAYDVVAAQLKGSRARTTSWPGSERARSRSISPGRSSRNRTRRSAGSRRSSRTRSSARPSTGPCWTALSKKAEMVTTGFFGGGRGPKPGVASPANLKELEVELDINEADIPRVRLGQR